MSNVSSPYGFKAVRHLSGGNVQTEKYTIASAYGTAIYTGDPVLQTTDGSIIIGIGTEGTPSVQPIGIFAGCKYVNAQGVMVYSPYWPASTVTLGSVAAEAYVYDDYNIIFQVQGDSTGFTDADRGQILPFTLNAAGASAVNGRSGAFLYHAGGTSGTGYQFRLLRLIDDGVNVSGAYTNVEVMFAMHALKEIVSSVGGI
jgi:hypothetical protein